MKKIYFLLVSIAAISSSKLSAQCVTPSVVPYYESFQSISVNNQLPPCWAISNPSTCLTYTTGNHLASFFAAPAGSNYFYTNAIQLSAGITYSAALWYQGGGITWTDLSILVGSSQSPTGLVSIVSTTAQAPNYTALQNTFAVTSSGVYYIAIKGTSNGINTMQNILWDDLSITIPCTPVINTPTVSVVASQTSICSDVPLSQLTMTAFGANSYSWNTGAVTNTINGSTTVPSTFTYVVTGTSSLSGCSSSAAISILVNPSPNLFIIASAPSICKGSSVNLSGIGAPILAWSSGQTGSLTTVTPTATTVYTLTGINSVGCPGMAVQTITVLPLPSVSLSPANPQPKICPFESVMLNASGAVSFTWNSGSQLFSGSTITFSAASTTSIMLTGADANNCIDQANFLFQIDACTGLNSLAGTNQILRLSPNPGNGIYKIESGNTEIKSIVITDLSGKVVFSAEGSGETFVINIRHLSNGIYQATISSNNEIRHLKIIKE